MPVVELTPLPAVSIVQLVNVARGWGEVAKALDDLLCTNLVLGIRDDFTYWHASEEAYVGCNAAAVASQVETRRHNSPRILGITQASRY